MAKNDQKIGIFLFLGLWMLTVVFVPVSVYAQVVINTTANIDFGRVDFAASHNGNIRLGTNGNVSTTGFGLASRNDGNAGSARVTSPDTGILEVKCSATGELVDPVATNLNITNVEIAINTGVNFGSGIACGGTQPADPVVTTLDMDALGDPDILIGGEIAVSGPITLPPDKVYSTSGGGTPIGLSIVVQ